MSALLLTTGGRRRFDLGRLNPDCSADYHGTDTAYRNARCRCPHALQAHRIYNKRFRLGTLEPVLLDATGTRRRIRGMWALGHPTTTIIAMSGGQLDRHQVIRSCQQERITPGKRALIVEAYRHLIVRPGSSERTRRRAQAAGYALPVQWGADIDDPNAVPDPIEPEPDISEVDEIEPEPDIGEIDEVAIELALTGRPVALTDQELIAAVHIGVARQLSTQRLATLLHVDFRLVRSVATGDIPPRLKSAARRRAAQLVDAP